MCEGSYKRIVQFAKLSVEYGEEIPVEPSVKSKTGSGKTIS